MVNRTLIRLKVVQMLYSYLLTRSDFRLLPVPEKQTRDSKAAYNLYLDFILLILELSGYNVDGSGKYPLEGIPVKKKLSATKMARSLAADSDIRELIARGNSSVAVFNPVIASIYGKITESEAFRDYSKIKSPEISDDVKFWCVILQTVFAKDTLLLNAARNREGFTQVGYDKAIEMVVSTLRDYSDTASTLVNATNALDTSLRKAYEMYFALFALMVEITNTQRQRLADAKDKYIPSAEDLNPNTRLACNSFITAVESNPEYEAFMKQSTVSWETDIYLVRELLDSILRSELYARYLAKEKVDFKEDTLFWRQVLRTIILPNETFEETLEAKSVFWNDDLDIMSTFVEKTMKRWADAGSPEPGFLPMFKDEEDSRFGKDLFTDAIRNREKYREYIDSCINTGSWDAERIAFMDVVIMTAILAEIINYPQIPVAVTMNEYLEIANRYSTVKSGQFITGVMYNLVKKLNEEGIIHK